MPKSVDNLELRLLFDKLSDYQLFREILHHGVGGWVNEWESKEVSPTNDPLREHNFQRNEVTEQWKLLNEVALVYIIHILLLH
jgi:hypothetical protein